MFFPFPLFFDKPNGFAFLIVAQAIEIIYGEFCLRKVFVSQVSFVWLKSERKTCFVSARTRRAPTSKRDSSP